MTPTPRSKIRYADDDPDRRVRTRLDFLVALMVVQIALTIGLLVDLHTNPKTSEPVTVSETQDDAGITIVQEPETPLMGESETPALAQAEPDPLPESVISAPLRVQVLNGCGVPGVARRTTEYLVRNGYDVRDVGNASRQNYRHSTITDRRGNMTAARDLARLLTIEDPRIVRFSGPPSLDVDLTLIIGDDYRRWPLGR